MARTAAPQKRIDEEREKKIREEKERKKTAKKEKKKVAKKEKPKKRKGKEEIKLKIPKVAKGKKVKEAKKKILVGAKKEKEIEKEFASMVEHVISKAEVKAEKITEEDILAYINISYEKVPKDWRKFVGQVIDKAMRGRRTARPGGFMTLDEYVKVAMGAARPRPVAKKAYENISKIAKKIASSKFSGMEDLEEEAVVAALELAALIELYSKKGDEKKINFKNQWVKKKTVV